MLHSFCQEHGILKFRFDPDSPSGMQVFVPMVNKNGAAVTIQPRSDEESIEECVERNETDRLFLVLPPFLFLSQSVLCVCFSIANRVAWRGGMLCFAFLCAGCSRS